MKRSIQMSHAVVLMLILGACGTSEPAGREEVRGIIQELRGTLGDGWSQLSPGIYQQTGADGVISQLASGRKGIEWRMQHLNSELANASPEGAIAIKTEIQSLEAVFQRLPEDEGTLHRPLGMGGPTLLASLSGDITYTCTPGVLTVTGNASWGNPYAYELTGFVTVYGDNLKAAIYGGMSGSTGSVSQTGTGVAACNKLVTGSAQVTITGCKPNSSDCTFFARSVPRIDCNGPPCIIPDECKHCSDRGLNCYCGGDVCALKQPTCP